jgi:prepilin-type N-terminal cleavage/methylation domain-containing protein
MQKKDGFTLIELMIVIAIIAIIAAIAIPGLLSSQRASNERNASASLKTLASAEADFRGNDRDGNKIQDFWTIDVSGLYGVQPVGSSEMIKLIELSVAGSDFNPNPAAVASLGTTGLAEIDPTVYTVVAPKAGYWYEAMLQDEASNDYAVATNGILSTTVATPSTLEFWNHAKFGFLCFPDSFSAGRNVFFVNEGNTIFKRTMNGPVKAATVTVGPVTLSSDTAGGVVGAWVAERWPVDSVLKLLYSKLD